MSEFTVEGFHVTVEAPYPCWVSIKTDRGEIRFSHHDLMALEFVVQRAKREVRQKLPENMKGEA